MCHHSSREGDQGLLKALTGMAMELEMKACPAAEKIRSSSLLAPEIFPCFHAGTNTEGGIPCHWKGCQRVCRGWAPLMDHLRKYHKQKLRTFRGVWFHTMATQELARKQRELYSRRTAHQ